MIFCIYSESECFACPSSFYCQNALPVVALLTVQNDQVSLEYCVVIIYLIVVVFLLMFLLTTWMDFHPGKNSRCRPPGGAWTRLPSRCGFCSHCRNQRAQTAGTFLYVPDSIQLVKEDKKSWSAPIQRGFLPLLFCLQQTRVCDSCVSLCAHKEVSVSRQRGQNV